MIFGRSTAGIKKIFDQEISSEDDEDPKLKRLMALQKSQSEKVIRNRPIPKRVDPDANVELGGIKSIPPVYSYVDIEAELQQQRHKQTLSSL